MVESDTGNDISESNKTPEDKTSKLSIEPDDAIQTFFSDDSRLKLIGEELANDTGRVILQKLHESPLTISELAKVLNISVQLVAYHIERMEKADLVEVKESLLSQKGKEMKKYQLAKMAILLILYPPAKENKESEIMLKKIAAKNLLRRILMTIVIFAVGFSGTFLLQGALFPILGPAVEPPAWYVVSDITTVIAPIIVASIGAVLVWFVFKRRSVSTKS